MSLPTTLAKKLLVVDDDALLRGGIARLMRKAGYEVRVAGSSRMLTIC